MITDSYATQKSAITGAQRALQKLGIEAPTRNVHFTVEQSFDDPTRFAWAQIDIWYTGKTLPVGQTVTPHDARLQRSAADAIRAAETPPCATDTVSVQQKSSTSTRSRSVADGNTKHREGSVVQNGVRRPGKPDGATGVIWAYLDKHTSTTLGDLKEYGGKQGWKPGNITSEFYAWRKFNGVPSTRKAKEPVAA